MSPRRLAAAVLWVGLSIGAAACSGGPILANKPAVHPVVPSPAVVRVELVDPRLLGFPADDGPHDRLTEWWYYTGHLRATNGTRYGFEFVVFRAERGAFPVTWASHLALTDEAGQRFAYAQRSEIGPQVDQSPRGPGGPQGFDLGISGGDPSRPATLATPRWTMAGGGGHDRLVARLSSSESGATPFRGGFGLDLRLTGTQPIVFQNRIGFIDFGPAGGSYYYSRPRMSATGSLTVGGRTLKVDGLAWFDHQWGDFVAVGGGGWDWFAVNLGDGSDLMLSLVRDRTGDYPLVYGTFVAADGSYEHLTGEDFSVTKRGSWTSKATGVTYPAGWQIGVPGQDLSIELTPTVAQQELDTRQTSGVIYWEGSQRVAATRAGRQVGGEAYVELTGYATPEIRP